MAKVLTGISGNLISAASAGFAPTNSADVSAIASAYQVVSATATQLYAGTAYVTSVNGAPFSASRAGNAANASLASSAWYDGTGRLISALPDSTAVSAIASAYQVVSSTATAVTGETAYLTSVNETPISAARAGDAAMASVAAKAYTDPDGRYLVDLVDIETLDSWTSGKQDTLTFAYNADSAISSINGSALAGQGGGGGSVASPSGTIIVTDGTAIEATNSAIGTAEGFEVLGSSGTYSYSYGSFYQSLGGYNPFKARGIGITYNSSTSTRTASVSANTPDGSFEASFELPASSVSAGVIFSDNPIYSVYDIKLKVNGTTVTLSGTNPALFLSPGTPYSVVKELAWKNDVPTIDLGIYSDYYGTYVSSINGAELSASMAFSSRSAASASYANSDAQGRSLTALAAKSSIPSGVSSPSATIITDGFYVEATNSAVATGTVAGYPLQSVTYTADNPYASLGPDGAFTVTLPEHPNAVLALDVGWLSYASTVSAVYGYKTATAAVPTGRTTALLNISNSTTARLYCDNYCNLNGASASAESATVVMGVGELAWASALPTYEYDAEDKISAINGSAIAGGAGGVDSATVSAIASSYAESAVSSYQPLSGMSGYASAFSAGEGLEFVQSGSDQVLQVEAPVDVVAGPGIVIDNPDGNTLRVSVAANEETVLWSGSANSGTFSENISAFEKVMFHMMDDTRIVGIGTLYVGDIFASGDYVVSCGATIWDPSQNLPVRILGVSGNYTGFTTNNACYQWWAPNDGGFASFPVTKVVGIHRLANN